MVEHQLPKLNTRVRFPSPAPMKNRMVKPFFELSMRFLFCVFEYFKRKKRFFHLVCQSNVSHEPAKKKRLERLFQIRVEFVDAFSFVDRIQMRVNFERSQNIGMSHLRAGLHDIHTSKI